MPLIRPVTLDDATGIARVHVETWRTAYRGIVPQAHLDGLAVERSADRWRQTLSAPQPETFIRVAEDDDGRIIGFASGGQEREGDPVFRGEVYALYILPDRQRQGIGRRLVRAGADWLLAHSYKTLLIWVLRDNPSRAFYEALGGRLLREKTISIGGAEMIDVAYGWEELSPLVFA